MSNVKRWLSARESEKKFWANKDVKALKSKSDWERYLTDNFGLNFDFFNGKSVLEVGCGPYGMIHFIDSKISAGIDPISYETAWKSEKIINVGHIIATGEYLPFKDGAFDVCICFNVIDHSINPKVAISEINRILVVNGDLLLFVDIISSFIGRFKFILNRLDKPHPHHFTYKDVLSMVSQTAFSATLTNTRTIGSGNVIKRFYKFTKISLKLAVASIIVKSMHIHALKIKSLPKTTETRVK